MNKLQLKDLKEYLAQLYRIKKMQEDSDWTVYSNFIFQYALNTRDFGVIAQAGYHPGEDPRNTAIRNELFRTYKDGILRTLSLVDEEIILTEKRIRSLQKGESNS
jgi:hypothetical protein